MGVTQPLIEPATRHVEEMTHDWRIKLTTMSLDERVLTSGTLRRLPIGPHLVSTTLLKVSAKAWEVQPPS